MTTSGIGPVLAGWLQFCRGTVVLPPGGRTIGLGGSNSALSLGRVVTPAAHKASQGEVGFALSQDLAVAGLTGQARSLRAAIEAFDLPAGDLIGQMQVARPSAPAFWTGRAENQATAGVYTSYSPNLAQPQVNRSRALSKTGRDDVAAGTYTFSLTVGDGDPVSLSLPVNYDGVFPDDNQAILRRLAQVIESASPELTATVETGTAYDENSLPVPTVKLAVATRAAGSALGFSLADEDSDLIANMGLSNMSRSGQDLTYVQGTSRATPYGPVGIGFWSGPPAEELVSRLPWPAQAPAAQVNLSRTLDPDQLDLSEGVYKFKLATGDRNHELSLDVKTDGLLADNNLSLLGRLARTIESAEDGLQAEVVLSEASDAQGRPVVGARLAVTNRAGRPAGSFTLADIDGRLLDTLGLNRVFRPLTPQTEAPANLGDSREADRFYLDQTRLATQVRQAYTTPAELVVGPAKAAVTRQVAAIAQGHNRFLSDLASASAYLSPAVGGGLVQDLNNNARRYGRIGLEVAASGRVGLASGFDQSLAADLPLVREGLTGSEGFLTVMDRHYSALLATGLDRYRTRRPGRVFTSLGQGEVGMDYFSVAALAGSRPESNYFRQKQQSLLVSLVA